MIIEIFNYELEQQETGFNLIELKEAQKIGTGTMQNPNGEIYTSRDNKGYNMRLETCVKKIIHLETLKDESLVVLTEFISRYKELKSQIDEILN